VNLRCPQWQSKNTNEEGAFKASACNRFEPKADYDFMLKMFGKNKGGITAAQERKVRAILMGSIRPFLRCLLRDKILRSPGW
jgi:hypothetical protein